MPDQSIPPCFHVLAKPSGATCNLACSYCFFLDKELLYPDSKFRMTEETLETYIQQLITAHLPNRVTVAWQGGEPTLMECNHKFINMPNRKTHVLVTTVWPNIRNATAWWYPSAAIEAAANQQFAHAPR